MTGLGLTALTGILVTGYYLNGSEADVQQTAKPQVAAAVASIAPSIEATAPVAVAAIKATKTEAPKYSLNGIATLEDKTDPHQFRLALSTDSLWAALKIEQIKPIVVTSEEIDKLGVNDAGDGKVFLIHELTKGGTSMKMVFPPTGMDAAYDIRVGDGKAAIEQAGKIASIMPTMVTDAKGKKLAFFFKQQMNDDNINIQSATFSQREGFDGDGNGGPEVSMNVNVVEQNDEVVTEDIRRLPEPPVMRGMKLRMNGTNINFDSLMAKHGRPMMKVFTSDSSFVRHFGGDDMDFDFDFDTLAMNNGMMANMMMKFGEGDSSAFNFKLSLDSGFINLDGKALRQQAEVLRQQGEQMRERGKQLQEHAFALRLNVDSLKNTIMKELKSLNIDKQMIDIRRLHGLKSDSLNGLPHLEHLYELEQLHDLKDLPQFHIETLDHPGFPHHDFDLPMVRVQVEKINNLVPIQIRQIDPNVKYNQNGLIFWYARDDKFAEKAPATLVERIDQNAPLVNERAQKSSISSADVINEPMVYPNPSQGRTMFKYSLKEPRAVSIAIHDLLGKRIKMITELEPKTSGEFEQELDLSSLEAGVYLLVMVTDAGEQITQRVVLEK